MKKTRIIPRLDVKHPNLIKGIQFEGLRVMGDPREFAEKYYREGADEIIYMDIVASLYGRNNLTETVRRTASEIFIPLTVGGGIRSVGDAELLLRAGADKVAINTAAVANPDLLGQLSRRFGAQAVVLSIEAKRRPAGNWEAYTDNGRERTGLDVVEWAVDAERRGAGEILLTSVDREGKREGFDIDLVAAVAARVSIPVIASGGCGNAEHLRQVVVDGHADAVAVAAALHYGDTGIAELKGYARGHGIAVRRGSQG